LAEDVAQDRATRLRPAILYALPDERQYFSNSYCALRAIVNNGVGSIERDPSRPAADNPRASTLQIGCGIENAYRNTVLLLESRRSFSGVIVAGFAGGLKAGLEPGAIVVSDRLVNTVSGREYLPDASLLAVARETKPHALRVSVGKLATTDRVAGFSADKHKLAAATGAIAVDMESSGVAEAATTLGVPWLAVRVITDGVDDDLPFDFNAQKFKPVSDMDGVNRGAIVASVFVEPWKIPALIRLGLRSSLAARRLAAYLDALLPQIGSS
jgi:adenosylhomocysteine nucleosidase